MEKLHAITFRVLKGIDNSFFFSLHVLLKISVTKIISQKNIFEIRGNSLHVSGLFNFSWYSLSHYFHVSSLFYI